jgi:hypothetical protein
MVGNVRNNGSQLVLPVLSKDKDPRINSCDEARRIAVNVAGCLLPTGGSQLPRHSSRDRHVAGFVRNYPRAGGDDDK